MSFTNIAIGSASESNGKVSGGMSKRERYGWPDPGPGGEFKYISKYNLRVDPEYQREANQDKSLRIASKFNWRLFGVAIVSRRDDGTFWVVDAQHRVLATMRRDDIDLVPCMVFDMTGSDDEAGVFLDINRERNPLRTVDQFRALIKRGNPRAMVAAELIAALGREPSRNAGLSTLACLAALMRCISIDEKALKRIWPLLKEVTDGYVFHERLMTGLLYLERGMAEGHSLTDARWSKRIVAIGNEKLLDGANRAASYYANGGPKVWADGIRQVIDKGLQNKLPVSIGVPGVSE